MNHLKIDPIGTKPIAYSLQRILILKKKHNQEFWIYLNPFSTQSSQVGKYGSNQNSCVPSQGIPTSRGAEESFSRKRACHSCEFYGWPHGPWFYAPTVLEYVATRCPKKKWSSSGSKYIIVVWSIWVNALVNLYHWVMAHMHSCMCSLYQPQKWWCLGMLPHPPGVQIRSPHFMVLFHGANALGQWILGQGSLVNGGKIYAKFHVFLPIKRTAKILRYPQN